MRRNLLCLLLMLCLMPTAVLSQEPISPRANVVAYSDEDGIQKLSYRSSPYFMEITGSWKQRGTDSSQIYTKQIDVSKSWKEYKVYLNVRCGRACRVSLNGKEVGYGDDSRHWNEFLLDRYLKYGKSNTVTIEALKNSRGAMLEDSTIAVGLNGEPFLLFKSDPCIADFSIVADLEPASAMGTLTLGANVLNSKKKGKYYVEVEVWDPKGRQLDRMGRWVVFDNRSEETVELTRTWGGVEAWTAETPTLYTVVVRLRNEKMEEEEIVGGRFGFRRVLVDDGVLKVNGHPVTLRGVTYGLEHTEGYASRQQMLRDVTSMKQNNVNAVRTSRYSPMDPYFYELCDQMGIYVIADVNLMPLSSQHHAVATDQDFIPLFEQRVNNLYGKYKNHTSIIAWSLGNSPDNGVCMTAAYKKLKQLEKNRPVIFAGAGYSENTDIIAPLKPTVATLRQTMEKKGERPVIILSCGTDEASFPQMEQFWQLVSSQRSLQGAFVDRWPLESMLASELKHLYSPFTVRVSKITQDEGEFIVTNNNDFASFANYSLDYTIYTNLRPNIISGDLAVAAQGGESDKVRMRIPQLDLAAGEELFIRFNVSRRAAKGQKPSPVGSVVFPLPQKNAAPQPLVLVDSLRLDEIDSTLANSVLLQFADFPQWKSEVVATSRRQPDAKTLCVDAMLRYHAPSGAVMYDVRQTVTYFSSGDIVIAYKMSPTDQVRGQLQAQVLIPMPSWADSLQWFGLDRQVIFANNNSGIVGVNTQAIKNSGNQTLMHSRWCAATSMVNGLFARLIDMPFTLSYSGQSIILEPEGESREFRLLLKGYSRAGTGLEPSDFMSVEYPSTTSAILDSPVITASSPRFSQPLTVTISSPQPSDIHYTIDGTEPTVESPLYTEPIVITATTVVKARSFPMTPKPQPKGKNKGKKAKPVTEIADSSNQHSPSFTATRKFNYDHIVRTTFSRRPNTPYNVGTDTILFDGLTGTVDDLSRGWLGFSGEAVVTTVELAKPVVADAVVLRYAHSPSLWAFAPDSIAVAYSIDGKTFSEPHVVAVPFNPTEQQHNTPQLVELRIPAPSQSIGFIRIVPHTIARIPAWHRAKGLNPWLMMDEIQIEEHLGE